ncbi:phosphate ABC transporter substrate-binding protein, PhoT family [Bellilinea caldifistulae]|uniref:PstS family phosphate ABC transporter substrate-binding protein n=1 Tax=Bellilinea caldifistulae TaxID=360411 RepID=UPI0009E30869|nr:PstS family phosphate ABC transporter substrate-binding protein [Bellilinea caldifistulae]GAP11393.1 phosphate ABC transporter substrate-binding protein, PhoT family [Bellilinea caldifistulae]
MLNKVRPLFFVLVVLGLILSACAPATTPTETTQTEKIVEKTVIQTQVVEVEKIITPTAGPVEGTILVDGSSTVAPITQAVAEEFQKVYPEVRVPVGISGTGGGFKKFCNGETDISDASRPIKPSEVELCQKNGIEYIELPVAFDGLAVMVNPSNNFAACLTVEELKKIWAPEAEGVITNWSQVREGFPNQPLTLYGAGTDSGTYDYFTAAIVGEEGSSRGDFLPSEDDNVLVQGIAGDPNALGFFGLAYYEENQDKLKLVAIDNGDGNCVLPDLTTVSQGTYQPLSRPLFIYVNRARVDQKDEISLFIDFYLKNAGQLSKEVGYIPLTDEIYQLAQKRYDNRVTGSIFEGQGSTIGVSLADLLAKE